MAEALKPKQITHLKRLRVKEYSLYIELFNYGAKRTELDYTFHCLFLVLRFPSKGAAYFVLYLALI